MAPGEARKAGPWGARDTEDKAAWWISMAGCARGCISNVGEGVGCDEYITKRHGKFRQIKAASSRRSALDRIWFRRPFHPDCGYGVILPTISADTHAPEKRK